MRQACEGEPFFGETEGKRYCVLHFPGADKKEAFDAAVKRKLLSLDFRFHGVCFPEGDWFAGLSIPESAHFTYATFDARADFRKTVFCKSAHFAHANFTSDRPYKEASFDSATFEGLADFNHATFNADARFNFATFKKKADFSKANFNERTEFRKARFVENANFWRSTFVKRADFDESQFSKNASFWPARFHSEANFRDAKLGNANFGGSTFGGEATFSWCTFGPAGFAATFVKKADFFSARFEDAAYFSWAEFHSTAQFRLAIFWADALFGSATFVGETDFGGTIFKDTVSFSAEHGVGGFGDEASCDFQHARFERPERVSFHTLNLRPHWFLNVDPRRFDFVAATWTRILSRDFIDFEIRELERKEKVRQEDDLKRRIERKRNAEMFGDEWEKDELEKEIAEAALLAEKKTSFHHLLSITCRQLAVNAEENHRYDEASDFRFLSMELRRKRGWRARGGRLDISIIHTLYRHLSGYGERIWLALRWLFAIWLISALLYTQVDFERASPLSATEAVMHTTREVRTPLTLREAAPYSLAVMILQRPEPRPATALAKFAVLTETILGPIQAALLALAVRRRFIR